MPTVEVATETFQRLSFAARLTGCTEGEIVDRLVAGDVRPRADGIAPDRQSEPSPAAPRRDSETAVHVVYRGTRVDGYFDEETNIMRLVAGPTRLVGRAFRSPSQAAIEVVRTLNPDRESPETNGWKFWMVTESGRRLESIRHAR